MKQKFLCVFNIIKVLSFDTHLWCLSTVGGAILLCMSFFIGPINTKLSVNDPNVNAVPKGKIIEYSSIIGDINISSLDKTDELAECIPDNLETEVEGFDTVEEAIEASGVPESLSGYEIVEEVYDDVPSDELGEDMYDVEPIQESHAEVAGIVEGVEYTVDDIDLLYRIVQCEAQSEDLQGRILIANVILNRVSSGIWGDSIYEVLHSPGQFDPMMNGAYKVIEPDETTKEAVLIALNGENISDGALYFQKSASKNWGKKTYLFRYGSHSFYR